MYLTNRTGKIYYELYGREEAPLIVFSHGVALDNQTFWKQVEGLKKEYRILIWDMPFHGKSSKINERLPFSETAADFLMELLSKLELRKAILVGQSLGSFVSQYATWKYPDMVAATVHIGGAPLYPKYSKLFKGLNPLISPMLRAYPEKSLYKTFSKHKALSEDTRYYMEHVSSRTGRQIIAHLTKEMVRDMVQGLPKRSEQPMLLTYGDHDISFIKKMNSKWHKEQPNSELAVIKDAHHIANQDNPEQFNAILSDFVSRLEPAPSKLEAVPR
ncbi:MAG: alpha/beta hydrolase [Bacillus sp. (in: Bacteria)]|nr:alpha/beta hydrolase [Bacillus sp. (in: firmicutes)]